MRWFVVKTSTVTGDVKLPRPKIVKDVLYQGDSQQEAEAILQRAADLPSNQSTPDITVVIKLKRSNEEKSGTSARPGNGKRNGQRNSLA